jgi:hypothetical protein
MVWTKKKPTIPGYYWLKMDNQHMEKSGGTIKLEIFEPQPQRVVKVANVDDGNGWDGCELAAFEGPDYEDFLELSEMSDHFEWSSDPINPPLVAGSCGCQQLEGGNAACSSCDPSIPLPR